MTIFKAGYRITAKSSENDYDYVCDRVYTTSDRSEARLLVKLGDMLRIEQEDYDLHNPSVNDLTQILRRFEHKLTAELGFWRYTAGATSGEEYESITEFDRVEFLFEYLRDRLVGYSETYFLRSLDSLSVDYIPEDIVLNDVTEELLLEVNKP